MKFTRSPWFRFLVRDTGLYRVFNAFLSRFPLPGLYRDLEYRCKTTESVSLAAEMFNLNCYDLLGIGAVKTVADIGCNTGYFPLLLAGKFGKPLSGIAVDANEKMVNEATWHFNANGLKIRAIHGKIGDSDVFHVCTSDTCSTGNLTQFHLDNRRKMEFVETRVPVIASLEDLWLENMGDIECGLLKIDIEGGEFFLLKNNGAFLKRVKNVVVEWHDYLGTAFDIINLLPGFKLLNRPVLEGNNGTAIFTRSIFAS